VAIAADRMVTFGAPMNLQTEPPAVKKITPLNNSTAVLFSGNVPDGEDITSRVRTQVTALQRPTTSAIAELVKNAYVELKKRRTEDTILRPFIGADFALFQQMITSSAASQILQQVLGLITQHNLGLEILVAGMDDAEAHLLVVGHPGILLPLDTLGYAAIGSGGLHASIRLSLGRQSKGMSFAETAYNVYEAKRASEVSPGVGKGTDLDYIRNGQIGSFKESTFDLLEKLHKERPVLSDKEIVELEEECKKYDAR